VTGSAFDVADADRRHLWHPYTQHGVADPPIPIARAEGAYVFDDTGRPIFDAISSWWVTLHGHAQPEIVAAVARQAGVLDQVIFAGFTHAPAAALAEELVRRAPRGLSRVFFSDDGSTAVEVAVKMALQHWVNRGEPRRRLIVGLENAYHGDTFGAMSVSARGLFTEPFAGHLFEVARLPDPVRSDVVAALERLIADREADIAAVIVEPMLLGAGGMRMWSAGALRGIRALTTAHSIPLIADEVLTGFGRTGPVFACEHAGIAPDLMCLSKGITGGFMALGATLATEELFDSFRSRDRSKTLFHGHSYTANPIACAAGVASLALFDEALSTRRRAIGRSHRAAAVRLEALPAVRNVRVLGTVLAMELTSPDGGYLSAIGPALGSFALERGVLLRPLGNTVYVLPPYCSTDDDLSRAYETIAEFVESRAR
jgi:adenosylmethionine-8-amino-7-oxononanoate aminotransferase